MAVVKTFRRLRRERDSFPAAPSGAQCLRKPVEAQVLRRARVHRGRPEAQVAAHWAVVVALLVVAHVPPASVEVEHLPVVAVAAALVARASHQWVPVQLVLAVAWTVVGRWAQQSTVEAPGEEDLVQAASLESLEVEELEELHLPLKTGRPGLPDALAAVALLVPLAPAPCVWRSAWGQLSPQSCPPRPGDAPRCWAPLACWVPLASEVAVPPF
mmetsp:Transcript_47067/g.57822  ORF Transcript_47067/g.57822 Transcript_47067/m.57822 type:complete len:214 (-) Transcript_47067:836-1477(-)